MLLSKKWLNDFVDINIDPHEFSQAMSLSGSKVEGVSILREKVKKVVVGRILSAEQHPNADRLKVCKVEVGDGKTLTLVTGAPNAVVGSFVPVALDGAVLPSGDGTVEIRAGDFRGIVSEGMMCSVKELGLTSNDIPYSNETGLLLLQEKCFTGQDINDVLMQDDTVYEFEITPNRPDCLSVRGLARECAATFGKELKLPAPKVKGGGGRIDELLKIRIDDTGLCTRYSARMVKDIKIEPSPLWMRTRLRAAGMRPINNIVDITNYVMLEYGQPMHAFDYSCLDDGQIVVRTAREGETLYTLDGQERKLTPNMLLIADAKKAVGVAGVMGGANSEITDKTTTIVFESATFNGPSVRKTALQLAMRTDASSRFEKGLDPENTIPAVERACELVELLGAGVVLDGIADVNHTKPVNREIPFDSAKINAFLGAGIPLSDMEKHLKALHFEVTDGVVKVPGFRADVEGEADIAEEVARLYGYNKIKSTLSSGGASVGGLTERQIMKNRVKAAARGAGFDEMLTYSFISPADHEKVGFGGKDCVTLLNPIGEDKSVMRLTTLPSLLTMLANNEAVRNPEARLYELGLVFKPEGGQLPHEMVVLALGAYGAGYDFFALKGAVESVVSLFHIKNAAYKPCTENQAFHPGRCAELFIDGEKAGILGEVHPLVAERYGIENRIYAAELNFDTLFELRGAEPRYVPMPKFPAVRRDIAVVCGENVSGADVTAAIKDDLLESCELFDVYTGSQIPEGQKSLAFKLVFRSGERTLTDTEIDARMANIVESLKKNCGAVLR